MSTINGFYLKSQKWRIFDAFHQGKKPKDVKDKYNVKQKTIYTYYWEFNQYYWG